MLRTCICDEIMILKTTSPIERQGEVPPGPQGACPGALISFRRPSCKDLSCAEAVSKTRWRTRYPGIVPPANEPKGYVSPIASPCPCAVPCFVLDHGLDIACEWRRNTRQWSISCFILGAASRRSKPWELAMSSSNQPRDVPDDTGIVDTEPTSMGVQQYVGVAGPSHPHPR